MGTDEVDTSSWRAASNVAQASRLPRAPQTLQAAEAAAPHLPSEPQATSFLHLIVPVNRETANILRRFRDCNLRNGFTGCSGLAIQGGAHLCHMNNRTPPLLLLLTG
jgi:hypothetical protein